MQVIKRHQTLLDFAVQYTGSAEGLVQLAVLNDLSITDDTPAGQLLNPGAVIDIKKSYQTIKKEIATEGRTTDGERLEGIGYWNITLNFKVS